MVLIDERLIQYRTFLEEQIRETEKRQAKADSEGVAGIAAGYERHGNKMGFVRSRDELYELFPELRPSE